MSPLSYLLFDGPTTINDLAVRPQIAPTTVSLMVSELSRKDVLERHEDEHDRRRRSVSITDAARPAISAWLSHGATTWRAALAPLTPAERRTLVNTLRAYEHSLGASQRAPDHSPSPPAPPLPASWSPTGHRPSSPAA